MNLSKWILILLKTTGATNSISFTDVKKLIESSQDFAKATTCPICLESLFILSSETDSKEMKKTILKEAKDDVVSFVERNSLISCPLSQIHIFHKFCFIKSCEKTKFCPLCRSEINENSFKECVLKLWLKFYDLKDDQKNFLISQLYNMRIELLMEVIKIFKFGFGESKLDDLKIFISNDDSWLINMINLYENEKDNEDLVFLSKVLLDLTELEITQIFTPENVSKLHPRRLLFVLKKLLFYDSFEITEEPILNKIILYIEKMNEYDEKFSVELLFEMIKEELNSGIKCFFYLKLISTKMVPKDPLEEEKILEFILNALMKNNFCLKYTSNALRCFPTFYKINDREFFEKLICFTLNQNKRQHDKFMVLISEHISECLYLNDIQLYTDVIRSIIIKFGNIINSVNETKYMKFIITSFAHFKTFEGEIGSLLNYVICNQRTRTVFIVNFKKKKINNEEFVKKVDEIIGSLNKN